MYGVTNKPCVSTDDLIDVVEGNRVYLKCIYVSLTTHTALCGRVGWM